MKLFVIALIWGASAALASPSETGLENGKRLGWEKNGKAEDCIPHSVPDAGGTLALLSLGVAGLAFWRVRLA